MAIASDKDWSMILFSYQPTMILPGIVALACLGFFGWYSYKLFRAPSSPSFLYLLPSSALSAAIAFSIRSACSFQTSLSRFVTMNLFFFPTPIGLAMVNVLTLASIVEIKFQSYGGRQREPIYLRPGLLITLYLASQLFSIASICLGGFLVHEEAPIHDILGTALLYFANTVPIVLSFWFLYLLVVITRRPVYHFELLVVPDMVPVVGAKHRCVVIMFITSILLLVRQIYALIVVATGYYGIVASQEWSFYVFDTAILMSCFIIHAIYFVGDYLPNNITLVIMRESSTSTSLKSF
ncbi:hypothetical protein BC940DRAFT_294700 [Gongronella butleri]|nr:hypothetical protein BC940DRAFT_294700 [Gongronella butleri]